MELLLEPLRAVTTQIDNILTAFYALAFRIFHYGSSGWMKTLLSTIINNDYLLIALSLVIIGFVIGVLKRIISI